MIIVPGDYKNDKNAHLACRYHYPDDFQPGEKRPMVIVSHGIGGSMYSPYIDCSMAAITRAGAIGVSFNLRGADAKRSDTRDLTPDHMISDIKHASRKFVQHEAGAGEGQTVFIGISYTANGIAQAITHDDCPRFKGIVMTSAVVKPLHRYEDKLTWRNLFLWHAARYKPAMIEEKICHLPYALYTQCHRRDLVKDFAPKINVPVTIIQGKQDEIGFHEDAQDFYNNLKPECRMNFHTLDDGKHSFTDKQMVTVVDYCRQAVEMLLPQVKEFQNPQTGCFPNRLIA